MALFDDQRKALITLTTKKSSVLRVSEWLLARFPPDLQPLSTVYVRVEDMPTIASHGEIRLTRRNSFSCCEIQGSAVLASSATQRCARLGRAAWTSDAKFRKAARDTTAEPH